MMAEFEGRSIERIAILTGAGVSAESGVPTFRDAGGLWEQHDPMQIATPEAFRRDPALVYRFYNARRAQLPRVQPNPAHLAIARLQREFAGRTFLVTQNVDDLHERAGSPQVCHMHGELLATRCTACSDRRYGHDDYDGETACAACGRAGTLRPDVVWFGEIPYFMDDIEAHLADCDLFIAVGTSGQVYPAAGFVRLARQAGALTLELNREPSEVATLFHRHRPGLASATVTALVGELLGG